MLEILALATMLAAANPALPAVTVAAPKATLILEVARTEQQREYGLMNRTALPLHRGMIFVFPGDGQQSFWMKDTLISLDMVFVAADGTVRKVFANVKVLPKGIDDIEIPLEVASAKYVIELAAGEAAPDGLAEGVRLDVSGLPPAQ